MNVETLEQVADKTVSELCLIGSGLHSLAKMAAAMDDERAGIAVIIETLTARLEKGISGLDAAVCDSRNSRKAVEVSP